MLSWALHNVSVAHVQWLLLYSPTYAFFVQCNDFYTLLLLALDIGILFNPRGMEIVSFHGMKIERMETSLRLDPILETRTHNLKFRIKASFIWLDPHLRFESKCKGENDRNFHVMRSITQDLTKWWNRLCVRSIDLDSSSEWRL